jgi:hypothetical protein
VQQGKTLDANGLARICIKRPLQPKACYCINSLLFYSFLKGVHTSGCIDMVRQLLVLFFCIVCLVPASMAKAFDGGTRSLAPAFQSLVVAIDTARTSNPTLVPRLTNLRERLVALEQNLNRVSNVPDEYDSSFYLYANLLAKTPLEEVDIRTVTTDAELKNRFLNGAAGFWPFDKTPLILVRVLTYRGETPAPGYNVSFNPLGDADRKVALFPFGSDTNNAARQLPPGNYFLRLYRGESEILNRPVPIGFAGTDQEEVKIDISVVENANGR